METTPVRKTSIEAYQNIRDNGLLSKRRFEVFEFIVRNGPCTSNKLLAEMAAGGRNTSSFNGRLSELRDMGVIEEVGHEQAETGNRVILWDVTGRLPVPLVKKETKTQIIARLTSEIAALRMKLLPEAA